MIARSAIHQAENVGEAYSKKLPASPTLTLPEHRPKLALLCRGFIAHVSIILSASSEVDLTISPRRPHENGVYKKRVVRVSSDYSCMTLQSLNFLNQRQVTLQLAEVHEVVDGVLQPEHAAYVDYNYTTLRTNFGLVILATERFSTAANLQLLCGHSEVEAEGAVKQYSSSVETLSSQLKIARRLLNRYRGNLEVLSTQESLNIHSSYPVVEQAYDSALHSLHTLFGFDTSREDWLRAERSHLTSAIQRVNIVIASMQCSQ